MTTPSLMGHLAAEAARAGVQHLAVSAVIIDRGTVLLLHRTVDEFIDDGYELPGGVAEPGEPLDAALARTVKRVSGLTVTSVGGYHGRYDYPDTPAGPVRIFQFTVRVADTGPVVLHRHDRYLWAPLVMEPVRCLLTRPEA